MSLRALVTTAVGIVIVAAVAFAVVYVRREASEADGRNGDLARQSHVDEEQQAVLEVEQVAAEHLEGGRPAWKIRLDRLAVQKGARTVTAGPLREGLIYDKDGNPAVRVTAERVSYDTASYDFDVEGKVRVVSPKGAVINTQKVHWTNEERTLSSPGQVTLRTQDDVTVTTAGMTFDTATQIVHCPNQVRMETERSSAIGTNLEYNLDTRAFTLNGVQMVIDIEEAEERTGRGS